MPCSTQSMPQQLLLSTLTLLLIQSVGAVETETSALNESDTASLERRYTDAAKVWGLTDQEWTRFERLKTGPRAYWSPQLDPLTVLGVEAETDAERQRYAELQVRLEAQRVERELAYQNAYTAAWTRLYPGLLPVQGLAAAVQASSVTSRVALFVKPQCPACLSKAKQLQDSKTAFDLYLLDSQGDDDQVRRWARLAGIDPVRVQKREITLNHDRGQSTRLGISGALPASYQQVNGTWQRLD